MSMAHGILLNQIGNVYEHYDRLLRLAYQQCALALPLPERLPFCGALFKCFCSNPVAITVEDHGHHHEYRSLEFSTYLSRVDPTQFPDRAEASRQRYRTILIAPEVPNSRFDTECLIMPLWYDQRYGGWIEVYTSRWHPWSANTRAVQLLDDLTQELAAMLVPR
jgi:hypothetical protein